MPSFDQQVAEFEKLILKAEILKHRGKQADIVRSLSISRTALYYKIDAYGLRTLMEAEREKRMRAHSKPAIESKATGLPLGLNKTLDVAPWRPEDEAQDMREMMARAVENALNGEIEKRLRDVIEREEARLKA